ncbi:hypothetical protein CCAX7_39210 [Capsulimonas corticalis]|uniref:Uncharacterized protein n=1 Tax=Capsulimonas corticalis TaxID=2219043 RepID=A0A402D3I6_9BACT|nr:hypothetical protein CCAX7_39210 [Capsulimonas corticalis]
MPVFVDQSSGEGNQRRLSVPLKWFRSEYNRTQQSRVGAIGEACVKAQTPAHQIRDHSAAAREAVDKIEGFAE